jgi:hypothetical protein
MSFNFTKIDNYVDKLADGVESIMLGGFVEPQVRLAIGYKFPVIYGVSFARNDDGQIVVNEKGLPMAGPEKVIGSVEPDFRLNYNTTFEIFKFRIGATLEWKQGGQMYAGTMIMMDNYGTSQRSADFRNKETEGFLFEKPAVKENADGSYSPNDIKIHDAQNYFSTLTGISEGLIADNSFVKLREVSISYPVYSKPHGLTVSLSAFARNIIVWTQTKGFDPEASQGNNNMQGAFERFSLPGTSSFGLGLNVKF